VFFQAHCEARYVTGGLPSRPFQTGFPVRIQRGSGRDWAFPGTPVYAQDVFWRQGLDCIAENGVGHVAVVAENVLGMTATSVPWPEVEDDRGIRAAARWTNLGYSILLPFLVLAAIVMIRRGQRTLIEPLLHLLVPFVLALAFLGDPRYRILFDVFGLVLLAAVATAASRPSGSRSS
jgi:hypothetical protein